MKVVIFAGGLGTRISADTSDRPKPMIEVGGKPILWHIMKYYSLAGHNEFIILGGWKCNAIKEYFLNYRNTISDFTINLVDNSITYLRQDGPPTEPWKITILDTGVRTGTAGRLLAAENLLKQTFLLTYGDGVGDIDLPALIEHASKSGKTLTLSTTHAKTQFGTVVVDDNSNVVSFKEKRTNIGSINIGFMVVKPSIFKYIDKNADIESMLEVDVFPKLVDANDCNAYYHSGFWKCVDTFKDKRELDDWFEKNKPAW
jgi:glucose-1-phosphate cytidylyltransferase